ncbi:C4-dicarboxylate ABC transporter permease [Alicycliphilus denitrificans]|uniref:TRAP transporter large permease n=1 Tax=Alicycliphilus denitrificans TaxID=179636 RepID=UPI00096414B4|nr:TRAP transporter large permease [Alicycliphilus denitrificans]MBN9574531.1 TRAP transporter large permease [Alicycliphilus denitrificans]OJW89264.1 MAG: C4-dicarboxylate ABC transporter permease [Alicycliphilus sp. 69-12]BCN40507.1 C4-dicarboxylate ABC transporter permease [Alicycliphilus denitrificans]
MSAAVILALLFTLLLLGAPIGFALILSGFAGILWVGGTTAALGVLASVPHELAGKFEFLTIPMFLLMAEFVLRSGVADDLFKVAAAWTGRVPGGLGMATALSGAGFGAICGSSTASAATLSATSLPAMLKHGYERRMAAGVVAISGTLAMLIPPSIAMIIYGLLADVNIGKLLIAGVVPAVLVTAAIMLTTYVLAKRDPSCAPLSAKVTWGEKFRLLRLVAPMLVLMMAVTGVIYTGVATPTEASAMGALVSAILYFMRGRRTWAEVADLFGRATRTSCMVAIILLGAHVFTVFFALTQTTQSLIGWVGALPVEPWVIIVALTLMYLVLGCFLDQIAILVLTVPIVAPLVSSLGFDLIWFGVIKIVTAELGMVTPPLGLNCFVVSKYSRTPVQDVFRGTLPHVAAHLVVLAVLLLFPALSLWLPSQMR